MEELAWRSDWHQYCKSATASLQAWLQQDSEDMAIMQVGACVRGWVRVRVCLSVCLSVCLFVRLFVCLLVGLCVHLYIHTDPAWWVHSIELNVQS